MKLVRCGTDGAWITLRPGGYTVHGAAGAERDHSVIEPPVRARMNPFAIGVMAAIGVMLAREDLLFAVALGLVISWREFTRP